MKNILIFIFLYLSQQTLIAQISGKLHPVNGRYVQNLESLAARAQSPLNDTSKIPFVLLPADDSIITTMPLIKKYPDLLIPYDSIKIQFPEMQNCNDTVISLWLIEHDFIPRRLVNVVLIGIKNNDIIYFIDNNNNGNFIDDNHSLIFPSGCRAKKITIKDEKSGRYTFHLMNPQYDYTTKEKNRKLTWNNNVKISNLAWSESTNQIKFHIFNSLTTAMGNVKLAYTTYEHYSSQQNIKREYTAQVIASAQYTLQFALSYRNIYIGLVGRIEQLEFGNKKQTIYQAGTKEIIYGSGNWPDKKIHYGIFTEYDINVLKAFRFSPYASVSAYSYLNNYPFQKQNQLALNEGFQDRYTYTFGGRIKYLSGKKTIIYLDVCHRNFNFDGNSYFSPMLPGSFQLNYKLFYFGIGLQYRI